MVVNELLMQFQSDMLKVPVIRPKMIETTALGAAYAAGLAVGFWANLDDLLQNWGKDKTWKPKMKAAERKKDEFISIASHELKTPVGAIRLLADRATAARAVLVGNAAQTIHPLGAQGFNLGLRDALTLAGLIEQARQRDRSADCGDAGMLARYDARRSEDRRRTLEFSDGLARLTANPSSLVRPLRSLGLLAINSLPSLQSGIVAGALGYRAGVPTLCRPPALLA